MYVIIYISIYYLFCRKIEFLKILDLLYIIGDGYYYYSDRIVFFVI